MIDSTHIKAHRSAAGGEQKQAIGRSRGGRNTTIHHWQTLMAVFFPSSWRRPGA
jgi:hypothetical protein